MRSAARFSGAARGLDPDDMWVLLTLALRTGRRAIFSEQARAYDDALEDDREFSRKGARWPAIISCSASCRRCSIPSAIHCG
jgi:hypothetical protein